MNCEECKEQVFELIEREAVDPEGVRAILERCPECRAEFEATKGALAAAAELPIEQPSAEVDSAILRAAEERGEPKVIPLRHRLLQAPPWAMAAIALLAIGVGVWSIPHSVEFEGDEGTAAPAAKETAKLDDAVATMPASEPSAPRDFEEARGLQAPSKTANRVAAPKASRARRTRAATPEPAPVEADLAEAEEAAVPAAAPSVVVQESQVAARRVARDEAYAGAKAEPAVGRAAMEAAADDLDDNSRERAACKSKVAAFETRLRDEKRYEPAPEEELAIGRCYQTLGDAKNARTWLERAAKHRSTQKRANEALQRLGPK